MEDALNYVCNLLVNNEPKEKFKEEIELKNRLHDIRMDEIIENDEENDFTEENFNDILEHLEKKSKKKYKFFVKCWSIISIVYI